MHSEWGTYPYREDVGENPPETITGYAHEGAVYFVGTIFPDPKDGFFKAFAVSNFRNDDDMSRYELVEHSLTGAAEDFVMGRLRKPHLKALGTLSTAETAIMANGLRVTSIPKDSELYEKVQLQFGQYLLQ
jgi:glucose/arabinose dehydrogenase